MTEDELRRSVESCLKEIAPEADLAHVDPRQDLRDELDLDSMDFLRFVQALHRTLGVEIPESDYRSVRSLSSCIAYCAARGAATPA